MSIFEHREFDNHEQVVFCHDKKSGLKAIIAVHNTNRGPALGGCRMWPYASSEEALTDVLRLSRGMTYKSAVANLNLGGGKSVIIGNSRTEKTDELLLAMGEYLEGLSGRYIAAEDSGTCVDDLKKMSTVTRFVAGVEEKAAADGHVRNGDPSPATAYGTFVGLKAAVKHKFGRDDLEGLKVAIQGVGNVGYRLAEHLHEQGAKLWVTDIYDEQVNRAVQELGATAVSQEEIFSLDVDVFAPCALGAIINDTTIPQLQAKVIAGASNNQLAEARHDEALQQRGILYAPDYVINAGGIIDVSYEYEKNFNRDVLLAHVEGIGDTLSEIFQRATETKTPTGIIADEVARERF